MRPSEVTTEQILQAGNAIIATGGKVSGFALRKQIGAGAPARLMSVWQEHNTNSPTIALPASLDSILQNNTHLLANTLKSIATAAYQEAFTLAQQQITASEQRRLTELDQHQQELKDASNQISALDEQLAHTQDALDAAQSIIEQQRAEIAVLNERLNEQNNQRQPLVTENQLLKTTCDALSAQYADQKAELAAAQAANRQLHERVADLSIRIEEQRAELSSHRKSLAAFEHLMRKNEKPDGA